MSKIDQLLEQLAKKDLQIEAEEAWRQCKQGDLLVDIRDPLEREEGQIPGAEAISRGFLELQLENHLHSLTDPVILICAAGRRSLLAAQQLRQLGFDHAVSVNGGIQNWRRQGLPIEITSTLSPQLRQRYQRHINIPSVGEQGQLKLAKSRVVIVGMGGLGNPISLYLAAAGVGHITLIDQDRIELSNLQRQILYREDQIGQKKVIAAKSNLQNLNHSVEINALDEHLDAQNAVDILANHDIIIDGTDNFPARYAINDACVKLRRPLIYGSVFRFEGQVAVFCGQSPQSNNLPCYRCLFPKEPGPGESPSCAEAGVFGALPGFIGNLQAIEALKILLGLDKSLEGNLLHYNALTQNLRMIRLQRDPQCLSCGSYFQGTNAAIVPARPTESASP